VLPDADVFGSDASGLVADESAVFVAELVPPQESNVIKEKNDVMVISFFILFLRILI